MSYIHIIAHRWFERGEGWTYDSSLPTELRQEAVRIMSKPLEQFRNDTITQSTFIGTAYLYIQVEADLNCPDPLAKNRHPSLGIGIISDEQLDEEQLQKYIEFARMLGYPGEFDIPPYLRKSDTPSKSTSQVLDSQSIPDPHFSILPLALILLLCISIVGFFSWGYIKVTSSETTVQNNVSTVENTTLPIENNNPVQTEQPSSSPIADSTTKESTCNTADSTNTFPYESVPTQTPNDEPKTSEKENPLASEITTEPIYEESGKQTTDNNTVTTPSEVSSPIIPNNTDVPESAVDTFQSDTNEQMTDTAQQPISNPVEPEPTPAPVDKQKMFNEELAQVEDKASKTNIQDFKTRLKFAQQKQQLCEEYQNEIPEIVSPKLEAIKDEVNTLSNYVKLSENFTSIEKASTDQKLIKADAFQKTYSKEDFPDAIDLFESISTKINQWKEDISQKIQRDLKNATRNQPQLFQFSERAKIAGEIEKVYRRYASYYPESMSEHNTYIKLADEQGQLAKSLQTQDYQDFERQFLDMKIKTNPHEQLDIAKALKRFSKANLPQADEKLFKEIDKTIKECQEKIDNEPINLSAMSEVINLSEWKLLLFKAGGKYYTSAPDKKMIYFIQMLNGIRPLQKKLSDIAQKNPDKQLYPNALFILRCIPNGEITTFKNEYSVSKKEYDNTINQIFSIFQVASFSDIEQKLNFKVFFQNYKPVPNQEFIILPPDVQKEIRNFVLYFCPNDENNKLVETAKQFNRFYKQRYKCDIIDSDECEVYPWYSIWLLSYRTFGLNSIEPQALVVPNATETVITNYINLTQQVRFASTTLENLLSEYFDFIEIQKRIEAKKSNTVPASSDSQ